MAKQWIPRVLVIGSDGRQGLSILRSLGRRGVFVVAGHTGKGVGTKSRYARLSASLRTGIEHRQEFADLIRRLVDRHGLDTIFPATEAAVIALDSVREQVSDQVLMLASRTALHTAIDKQLTQALFDGLGVPSPATAILDSVQAAKEFGSRSSYPIVLKPIARPSFTGSPPTFKVAYAGNLSQLKSMAETALNQGTILMAQSYAPGIKLQHGVVAQDGRTVAMYEYLGIRESPITGGVTSLHVARPITPDIAAVSHRVIEALGWSGLAGVEYRYVPHTGEYKILEVNGRAWGAIAGAAHAGLDFPWIALQVAHGRREFASHQYASARTQDILGDVRCWIRRRHAPRAFPEALPTSYQLCWAVIRDLFLAKSEYWSPDDVGPAVAAYSTAASTAVRGLGAMLLRPSPPNEVESGDQ